MFTSKLWGRLPRWRIFVQLGWGHQVDKCFFWWSMWACLKIRNDKIIVVGLSQNVCVFFSLALSTKWGNEGIHGYDGDLFPHSLQRAGLYIFSSPLNFMYMSFHLLGMFVMFVDGFEDVITEVCWETSIYSVSPPFCFFCTTNQAVEPT